MTESTVDRYVLVGVDGSESSLRAVRWAARVAQRRHEPLRIVTVVDDNDVRFVYSAMPQEFQEGLVEAGKLMLADADTRP
ncbi:universal stress protein [Tsukamurella soli]|uniref:UspA domain-containing protein n=1 Tax=Tsukamurella soli TaxID=644556 RepID=A0ABP8JIL3_9ACTN